jgi:hypothetical protein
MPLVLSLRKGDDFYVGNEQFVIDEIHSDTMFRVRHERTGKLFEVAGSNMTRIMNDVFLSAGERPQAAVARVAIKAPANITVLRGEKYRNPPAHLQGGGHADE